jgi:hypothetical protein
MIASSNAAKNNIQRLVLVEIYIKQFVLAARAAFRSAERLAFPMSYS